MHVRRLGQRHAWSVEREDSLLAADLLTCYVAPCFVQGGRVGNHSQGGRIVIVLFSFRLLVLELWGLFFCY